MAPGIMVSPIISAGVPLTSSAAAAARVLGVVAEPGEEGGEDRVQQLRHRAAHLCRQRAQLRALRRAQR